jgi:hypothetical protein
MKCKRFEECGREVYYEPSGLCLAHEKEARKRSAAGVKAAETKKAREARSRRRTAAKKAAAGRRTTEAPMSASRPPTQDRSGT